MTAQDIISKAIDSYCSGLCNQASVKFTFRNKSYTSTRRHGMYTHTSIIKKDGITTIDILNNTTFKRFINDSLVALSSTETKTYANALNSVIYFAWLPYGLEAAAIKKELLNEMTIKGKTYYKIGISFTEEGGGEDFEDRFMYWFDKTNFSLDYIAYAYQTNGGGLRFRATSRKTTCNGITFQDYNNYKPTSPNASLNALDQLFIQNKLELVSNIKLEALSVDLLQ